MRGATRRCLLATLPWLGGAGLARAGEATPYPAAPISLVVPFTAGGAADIAGRLLAKHAARHLPNPAAQLRVENRAGASGALGTQAVARARPDGLTLLLARVASSAILPATDPRTPYGWDDFTILGLLEETPFVVCVRADAPWDRLAELLAALREQPGRLAFATSGAATLLDLGVRHLFIGAGLPIDAAIARPFRGGGEAVKALLDGQVQFIGMNLSEALPALRDGTLRGLVIGTKERLRMVPTIPTAREAEVPSLAAVTGWSALFGPPGLEEAPMRAWQAALAALREDAAWQDELRATGSIPRLLRPEETRAFIRAQVALYQEIGRRLGLI
ncbi:Bug family tripartite tricarboxylate transporter substrate binding protein [Paracraurococcus lichenis]|uniref:Tripartite tricarboxylate transporter substrate binding protein n=1 Tax=Paracraurococcus lichenis TaxID=3064888 RepID=A0ABT9DS78_9PROT|nr:tripartite tricarboxylate transporter substrate binding protein [Paracraurococcus sp. LOR1-02]MDO9706752.1 tripartite tricarboxylate transporter substrate binding protein [Paracraurococcus sp. LOR1-02]